MDKKKKISHMRLSYPRSTSIGVDPHYDAREEFEVKLYVTYYENDDITGNNDPIEELAVTLKITHFDTEVIQYRNKMAIVDVMAADSGLASTIGSFIWDMSNEEKIHMDLIGYSNTLSIIEGITVEDSWKEKNMEFVAVKEFMLAKKGAHATRVDPREKSLYEGLSFQSIGRDKGNHIMLNGQALKQTDYAIVDGDIVIEFPDRVFTGK